MKLFLRSGLTVIPSLIALSISGLAFAQPEPTTPEPTTPAPAPPKPPQTEPTPAEGPPVTPSAEPATTTADPTATAAPAAAPTAAPVSEPAPAPAPAAIAPLTQQPPAPALVVAPAAAASAPEDKADEPLAGYKKGFFLRSADDKFLLKIGARMQFRFTFERLEGEPDEFFFSLRRGRLTFKGHAFTPDLTYKFQAAWDKGGIPTLKDWLTDYRLIDGVLHVRVGQYKKPFSREQLTSSGKLELIDRSITDKAFHAGRDIGLTVHNNYAESPSIEYALGFFNGSGDKSVFSAPGKGSNNPGQFDPLLVARLGYNHGKLKGYSQVDFAGGAPRFGVAGGAQLRANADEDDDSYVVTNLDYIFKAHGFATTGGAFFGWAQDGAQFKDQAYESTGIYAQASYLLGKKVAPSFRYAVVLPEASDANRHEILGGLGVYPYKHKLKVQLDAGALLSDDPAGQRTDVVVRSQLQLSL